MLDWAGIRIAISETRRHILSHHAPGDWDRCYAPTVFGRRIRVCARCLGIYPAVVIGAVVALVGPSSLSTLGAVAVLPLPALFDWAVTAFTDRRGHNPVRTLTGLLLGYGYGVGLVTLVVDGELGVLAIGVCYAALAGVALALQRRGGSRG
jgi:uncharacterized membrane protein